MKRTALTLTLVVVFLVSTLAAQDTAANDEYITAMTNNDPAQRVKLLKEWLSKYGGTGHQYENFANATVCTEQYRLLQPRNFCRLGSYEVALGFEDREVEHLR